MSYFVLIEKITAYIKVTNSSCTPGIQLDIKGRVVKTCLATTPAGDSPRSTY